MSELVSVIIPTRHRPHLACTAVASALAQTYEHIEVIVVIDGPDPVTSTVLNDLQEPRLRILPLPKNVGACAARNIGARNARGHWIALLDDDDEWLPDKLQRQLTMAKVAGFANPLIACRYYFRTDGHDGEVKPRRMPRPNDDLRAYIFKPYCALNNSTYVCTRDLFLSVPFDESLTCLQDIDWYIRVMNRRDVSLIVVPEVLSVYNNPSGRETITARRSWEVVLRYAKEHRSLMTRRTYARFIVKYCVRTAARQRAGLKALLQICAEMFRSGSPDLETVALFVLFSLKA